MKKIEDVKIGDIVYEIDGNQFRERGKVVRICKPEGSCNVFTLFFDETRSWNYIVANPGSCIAIDYSRDNTVYVWDNIPELKIIHGYIIGNHLSQLANGLNALFGGNLIKD